MNKIIASLVLFLFAFVLSLQAQPKIGEFAKEIVLKNPNGSTERLSDHKGKYVLVDFWASWCGPCRDSNEELRTLYSKYKDKGFEIFGISLDQKIESWKMAIKADRITWKQVTEPGGWDAPVALSWGIEALPTSFLLNKEGRVIEVDPSIEKIELYLEN